MNFYHSATSLALQYLPKRYFLSLRSRYFWFRKKLEPLTRLVYGSFNSDDLKRHLNEQLPAEFEILMVHSSFNSLKRTYNGSAVEFVKALVEYCGPNRTLVMPAFYFGNSEIGNLRDTLVSNPRFDLRRTPSQMGFATEIFRRWEGVIQSRHPVYRLSALGPLATKLTHDHEFADGPAGIGSPFEFMTKHKTMIVGIGKSFEVMTQTHHVEGVMGDEFPISITRAEDLHVTLVDGKEERNISLKNYHMNGQFNISKLPSLLGRDNLKLWKFHGVPMFLAEADLVTNTLVKEARRGNTLYD